MSVPRELETTIEEILKPIQLFEDDIFSDTELAESFLLGSIDRGINSQGNVITVGLGEDIQLALDKAESAGGGVVYLSAGTYNLSRDIVIPSKVHLRGVSRDSTIIDFGGGAYSVRFQGQDAYTTGTIAISGTGTTVTGTGTAFTSDMVGQQIFIDDDYYNIDSVTNGTSLEIDRAYGGAAVSGDQTAIATGTVDNTVENMTIQNSTAPGIKAEYSLATYIRFINVYECSIGIDFDYCIYPVIYDIFALLNGTGMDFNFSTFTVLHTSVNESTTGHGWKLNRSGNSSVFDCAFDDNNLDGINFTDATNIAFLSITIAGNGSQGVEFVSGCKDIQFYGVAFDGNTSDGVKMSATTDRIMLNGCIIINNGGFGVNIAASTCDENQIVAPLFENNTSGDISDSGTDTRVMAGRGVDADNIDTTAVGNIGTGEDDLITYSLPADTFNTGGRSVRIKAWGQTANNANAKTLKLHFGSTTILTNSLTTSVAGVWSLEAIVTRTATDSQDYFAELRETGTSASDIEVGTATEDDGAAITIKCTGQGTSNSDVIQEGLLVEVINP